MTEPGRWARDLHQPDNRRTTDEMTAQARLLGGRYQVGELLGYGGGRIAERGGGRGHRPVRADGVQDPEPAHIEHKAELISHLSFCNWTLSDGLARLEP